ncbi:DUF6470 family protein [Paenibacillus spongiae]|uniref:DUF6470 family protein n=1 Tax=Paenibacillus spongiae TaxID=2909671 RepID=A0ABY5SBJ3_9BACL|nr:DUF6470 family protein [Paenibacillus spongiae]UVI29895.1 DUF6470 family protein [Paenibacillus spongiae]
MLLPIIQAESIKGRIGIESQPGQYDIKTRRPELQIESTPAQISAPMPVVQLNIDQSRMWEAFHGGKPTVFWNRIYSQMPDIALQGIAKTVEKGNRMGDLRIRVNPIPDLALEQLMEKGPALSVFGPATPDNVDIHFTIPPLDVQVTPGHVEINAQVYRPEIEYRRSSVRVSMEQYPNVQFRVTNLDLRI